jgi:hypothetical protein
MTHAFAASTVFAAAAFLVALTFRHPKPQPGAVT